MPTTSSATASGPSPTGGLAEGEDDEDQHEGADDLGDTLFTALRMAGPVEKTAELGARLGLGSSKWSL